MMKAYSSNRSLQLGNGCAGINRSSVRRLFRAGRPKLFFCMFAAAAVFALLSSCSGPYPGEVFTSSVHFHVIDSSTYDNGQRLVLKVQLPERVTEKQLDTINSILHNRNSGISKVLIYYLLPGQKDGIGSWYGRTAYGYNTIDPEVKKKKQHDLYGLPMESDIFGIDVKDAKKMLAITPPDAKTIIGKFIDDDRKVLTVIYTDTTDAKGNVSVAEFSSDGKMTPMGTIPVKPYVETDGEGYKFDVSKDETSYTLVNNVLTMYAVSDNDEVPYMSIKSGK